MDRLMEHIIEHFIMAGFEYGKGHSVWWVVLKVPFVMVKIVSPNKEDSTYILGGTKLSHPVPKFKLPD